MWEKLKLACHNRQLPISTYPTQSNDLPMLSFLSFRLLFGPSAPLDRHALDPEHRGRVQINVTCPDSEQLGTLLLSSLESSKLLELAHWQGVHVRSVYIEYPLVQRQWAWWEGLHGHDYANPRPTLVPRIAQCSFSKELDKEIMNLGPTIGKGSSAAGLSDAVGRLLCLVYQLQVHPLSNAFVSRTVQQDYYHHHCSAFSLPPWYFFQVSHDCSSSFSNSVRNLGWAWYCSDLYNLTVNEMDVRINWWARCSSDKYNLTVDEMDALWSELRSKARDIICHSPKDNPWLILLLYSWHVNT